MRDSVRVVITRINDDGEKIIKEGIHDSIILFGVTDEGSESLDMNVGIMGSMDLNSLHAYFGEFQNQGNVILDMIRKEYGRDVVDEIMLDSISTLMEKLGGRK